MTERKNLYLSDVLTGILAALALKRVTTLSRRRNQLDRAFERLFKDVLTEAQAASLNVRFRIMTHPVHGDSPDLRQALYEAAQRDLLSFDNPEFQDIRLKISAQDATEYFTTLPGPVEMYRKLAGLLLDYYRQLPETETANIPH